jgi:hypothetical protein
MNNTLLTDLNPTKAATVTGAANFVRCLLAGACIAALQPITDRVGLGWCFGIYGVLQLASLPTIWVLETHGLEWRKQKAARPVLRDSNSC